MQGKTPHETALAAADGGQRAQLAAGMTAAAAYITSHTDAPIPTRVNWNIPVPPGPDAAREAFLAGVADGYGVGVHDGPAGSREAVCPFGAITIEAHYTPAAVRAQNLRVILHGEAA